MNRRKKIILKQLMGPKKTHTRGIRIICRPINFRENLSENLRRLFIETQEAMKGMQFPIISGFRTGSAEMYRPEPGMAFFDSARLSRPGMPDILLINDEVFSAKEALKRVEQDMRKMIAMSALDFIAQPPTGISASIEGTLTKESGETFKKHFGRSVFEKINIDDVNND